MQLTRLCGYVPFSSADPVLFRKQLERGTVEFSDRYWESVSSAARDFTERCLTLDPEKRITAEEALQHRVRAMLTSGSPSGCSASPSRPT